MHRPVNQSARERILDTILGQAPVARHTDKGALIRAVSATETASMAGRTSVSSCDTSPPTISGGYQAKL